MDRVNDILSDLELKSRAHPKPTPYTRLNMFCPRFDVRETASAYELHGELPGIVMRDINIEFTEDQTITIRGKIERLYEKDERRLHIPGIDKGVELPKDGEEEVKEVKTREEVSADTARAIAEGGKYWYHERQVGCYRAEVEEAGGEED
ncbi:putative 30 kDa heat shock protein [Glarea lozoyensis 74030]|uniref:Putative 30 kDa heat shock protein n=1 Tax=Glarea lozoyensis (strain ATCC 74030 / MF5533) TaxID=1104152 RepID=H0EXF1_GLAL7|nr:putative 30 kDa heat shock protein [Glarea lozoyensis 74030]